MSSASTHDDVKHQVRQSVDIVDLVGGYLELRRQGRIYVALCPWHQDSRPSLQINPERQSWKCWVCDIGGDIFSFVMRREGIGFREALEMLADRAGVSMSPRRGGRVQPGSPDDKQTLFKAMSWAVGQFHEMLSRSSEADPAREYLKQRGLAAETIERFQIGFSPNRWQWLADRSRTTPFSEAVLEATGLIGRSSTTGKTYDRFRGRILFPIRDVQGRTIAFGGRILPQFADEKSAKYVNSPETRIYSKSDTLFALDAIRDSLKAHSINGEREIIVVEGYTDALMAWQHGLRNVAAVCGTALGPRHVQLLRRFADTVTLVLDGDQAGQRRTNEILELFVANQVDLRIAALPEDLDPCDFLISHGADSFRELISQAVDALEHKFRVATKGVRTNDTHRANQAMEEILRSMALAPRSANVTDSAFRLKQEQLLVRLARHFKINESTLRSRLAGLQREKRSRNGDRRDLEPHVEAAKKVPAPNERELLELLTRHPDFIRFVIGEIPSNWLASDDVREIFQVYVRIHQAGGQPDFQTVMTELDHPDLKNLLVEFDESARAKGEAHAESLLADVITAFQRSHEEQERRDQLASLEDQELNEQDQISLLRDLFDQKRQRQGISAPTDG